jgi:hypothetical protein
MSTAACNWRKVSPPPRLEPRAIHLLGSLCTDYGISAQQHELVPAVIRTYNRLNLSDYHLYHFFYIKISAFSLQNIFMCLVRFSQRTAIISIYLMQTNVHCFNVFWLCRLCPFIFIAMYLGVSCSCRHDLL